MKVVLQDDFKDCGVCCLLSIIRYYGGDISKEILREKTHTTKEGTSAYNIIETARSVGFQADGYEAVLDNIEDDNLPLIAHLLVDKNYKHFVVIYKIDRKNKKLIVMDPAIGKRCISFDKFNLLSTHVFIILKPVKKIPIINKNDYFKRQIIKSISSEKIKLLCIVFLTISISLLNVFCAFHFKYLLEYTISAKINLNIMIISYVLIVLYLFREISSFIRNIILYKYIELFDIGVTKYVISQILFLPYSYYKNRHIGEIISRLKDLNVIKTFISQIICIISIDLLSVIIFGIIMYFYQSYLTICIFIVFFLIYFFQIITSKNRRIKLSELSKKEDILNSKLIESMNNVDTLKENHIEKRQIDVFINHYIVLLESNLKYSNYVEFFNLIKKILIDISYLIIYGGGIYYVSIDKMSITQLLIYQTFFGYLMSSSNNIISVIDLYYGFVNSFNRVSDLFSIDKEIFINNNFYLGYDLNGKIKYNNLVYKIGSRYIFNGLNLVICPKDKILLSGKSGIGKSTLVKILLRYIEVDYNMVSINNIDINHYHLENLRNNITYLTNNEQLFTDSIYNNLTFNKDIDKSIMDNMLKLCQVDKILSNKGLKLNNIIEDNGSNFSYGERQRLILARSLLRNSNIYILDEALSQVDFKNEEIILKNIFDYFNNKTIIVISHHKYRNNLFNRVIYLKDGKAYEKKL